MSNKNLIYSWNISQNTNGNLDDIRANQSVIINKVKYENDDYLLIQMNQTKSTPGIIINKTFTIQKNKVYILEVDGFVNRKNSAFLFAEDSDGLSGNSKRLIENYTFISNNYQLNQGTCAGWCCNYVSDVEIGILVTNPKLTDKVYIKEIKLIERDKSDEDDDCNSVNDDSCLIEHNSDKNSEKIENIDTKSNNLSKSSNINDPSDNYKLNLPCEVESCIFEKSDNYKLKLDHTFNNNDNKFINEQDIIDACCGDEESADNVAKNNFTSLSDKCYLGHKDIPTRYNLCQLFNLPKCSYQEYQLKDVVESSLFNHDNISDMNRNLSTGWTFFAQFISHDLTFNQTKIPVFDLHSLYGNNDSKYLFSNNKFLLNYNNTDLYRNTLGIPIIPDARNDDNYIIAQLHVLFLLFHNKLVDYYSDRTDISNIFNFVKKEVIYYFQWIIVNDYLSRLIDNDILNSICKHKPKYYSLSKMDGCIPIEFALASFRYGHFTLKNYYNLAYNLNIPQNELHNLTKGSLPDYVIDWTNFFDVIEETEPEYSKKINCSIARDLNNLEQPPNGCYSKPVGMEYELNSLFLRTLLRGQQFNLTSGQNIALAMGLSPIPKDTMKQFDIDGSLERNNMLDHTPLIIYILKEAEIFRGGEMLTGVGGIIVAEVLLSVLMEDSNSYFNSKNNWKPSLPSKEPNDFTIGDLISFVYS